MTSHYLRVAASIYRRVMSAEEAKRLYDEADPRFRRGDLEEGFAYGVDIGEGVRMWVRVYPIPEEQLARVLAETGGQIAADS